MRLNPVAVVVTYPRSVFWCLSCLVLALLLAGTLWLFPAGLLIIVEVVLLVGAIRRARGDRMHR